MIRDYDLIVIGTGVAASVAIHRCRQAAPEWKIAVIDHRPFGGTCALRGCDPKKVLVGAAEAVDRSRSLRGRGVHADEIAVDWPELMAFKRSFTDPVPQSREAQFAEAAVDTFHGRARFSGPAALTVGEDTLHGRRILVAAGAEPMRLGIEGEEHLVTSDEFLELERLPRRVVFVGGGYIAFEFAHVAQRAGADVTVLQRGERVLSAFDPDLVDWLVDKTRALGVDVRTGTSVEAIERRGDVFSTRASAGDNAERFESDLVVHAAGRVPALEALDLDAAGIAHEKGRLALNEFLQSTSNAAIYAAGDAAQTGPPLTPVSSQDGAVAAANIVEGNRTRPDYTGVPSVVFSIPPLASVGLREKEARDAGIDYRLRCEKTSTWYTNRRVNEEAAGFKILIENGSDRIVGAHLLGPHADEQINLFALAMRSRLSARHLEDAVFAYPTSASDLGHML